MAESMLGESLDAERAAAARALLGAPLLDAGKDPHVFRLVVRHATWLTEYFEQTCGWTLTVDGAGGFARLAKRGTGVDVTRPLRRTRGERVPFARRRYQLLCLICAELVRHPVTTVGLLASAVTADAALDTSRYAERASFVDALRALVDWGALRATAGEVDAFIDSVQANALLTADTARLYALLVVPTPPSSLPATISVDEAMTRLLVEPRYGDPEADPESITDESRNRFARHRIGRRLLDDPVVYFDDLTPFERDYVVSLSGRRWLRDRTAAAGFELEERLEGLLAVDPDAEATDQRFPAPVGAAHQLALLLIDRLVPTSLDGRRGLGRLAGRALRGEVDRAFTRFPGWAKGARDADGPDRLLRDAIDLLAGFGLVRREPDGAVAALPAIARYRVGEPVVHDRPTLFDEEDA